MIDDDRGALLRQSFQATCTRHGVRCHAMGFMPDHVHLAVSIPPKIAVSNVVAEIKGAASHLINHRPDSASCGVFGWQSEFGVLSFGERSLPAVTAYVLNQVEHHTRGTLYPGLERIDRREAPEETDGGRPA